MTRFMDPRHNDGKYAQMCPVCNESDYAFQAGSWATLETPEEPDMHLCRCCGFEWNPSADEKWLEEDAAEYRRELELEEIEDE